MHRTEYLRINQIEAFEFAYLKDLPNNQGLIAVGDDDGRDKGGHHIVIDTQLPKGIYSAYGAAMEAGPFGVGWALRGFGFVYGDGGGEAKVLGWATQEEGNPLSLAYRNGLLYGLFIGRQGTK